MAGELFGSISVVKSCTPVFVEYYVSGMTGAGRSSRRAADRKVHVVSAQEDVIRAVATDRDGDRTAFCDYHHREGLAHGDRQVLLR